MMRSSILFFDLITGVGGTALKSKLMFGIFILISGIFVLSSFIGQAQTPINCGQTRALGPSNA